MNFHCATLMISESTTICNVMQHVSVTCLRRAPTHKVFALQFLSYRNHQFRLLHEPNEKLIYDLLPGSIAPNFKWIAELGRPADINRTRRDAGTLIVDWHIAFSFLRKLFQLACVRQHQGVCRRAVIQQAQNVGARSNRLHHCNSPVGNVLALAHLRAPRKHERFVR